MDKIIDFDTLFEEKAAEYMKRNAGKYTEQQWEAIIPKLYREYGDTYIKRIDNTPKGYFASLSDEHLVELLKAYFEHQITINDFMRSEFKKRNCIDRLIPLLGLGDGEVLDMISDYAASDSSVISACGDLLKTECNESVANRAIEYLKDNADLSRSVAISLFQQNIRKDAMLEILSACHTQDNEIFELLLNELRTSSDDLTRTTSFLARYGDERALPVLLEYISREDINYLEYRELKYAIEALGGEYNDERDFFDDAYFREISEQSQSLPDFMDETNKQS